MDDTHIGAFTHVYKTNMWGNNHHTDYSGSSGGGSTLQFNKPYIAFLKDFITKNRCSSVVDIGCGDFQCGPSIYDDLDISYTGYDAYDDLIKHHTKTYEMSSKFKFQHLDSFAEKANLAPADLCIMKDVIQHWPNAHIYEFLDYLIASRKYKHILLCNGSWQTPEMKDIKLGHFRPLLNTLEPLKKYPLSHIFSYNGQYQHVYLLSQPPDAIVKILCASSKRKATMETQMRDLNLSFPVSYFEASVPSNSQEWMPERRVDWYQRVLCCLRTHLRVICEAASPEAPSYTIILEDDASIHQKDFEPVIRNLIKDWEAGVIKEPYVSTGWVPMQSYTHLDTQFHSNQRVQGLSEYRYVDQKLFGTKSYVIRRDSLKEFLPLLQHNTFAELNKAVHAKYSPKDIDIAYADNLLPIIFGTRRVFPPVVIEQSLPSIIDSHKEASHHDAIWNNFFSGSESKRKDYWTVPSPTLQKPDELCFAILAKNKAGTLPFFLDCLLNQTYPKSKIHLYIRTNDNTDDTTTILQTFVKEHGAKYRSIFFDSTNISSTLKTFRNHEWNPIRFGILGRIRQESVDYAKAKGLHYFVADCDNFITSITLEAMMKQKHLGVIAPMLTNTTLYSNYHYDIDNNGYMKDHPLYIKVLNRNLKGLIEMPVVHCTYFISHHSLNDVCYDDGSARYEYVIFSDGLRKKHRPQYLDNRFTYGFISQKYIKDEFEAELIAHYRTYLSTNFYNPFNLNPPKPTPTYKVWLCGGLGNRMFQIASIKGLATKNNCNFQIAGYNRCASHKNSIYQWMMERLKQDVTPVECDYGTCRTLELYKGYRSFEQLLVHHMGHHPVQVSQENTLFYGFYQSEQYFESIRPELLELFTPRSSVVSELKAFETSLGKSLKNMVAIHIRLGDYLHSGIKDIHFINLESYYKRCVENLPTQSDLEFMIVCEEPDKISSVYPTLVPFLESRGHISWSKSHSEEFDLFLLASCSIVVCGNSTFAWWGSWLNQISEKRVYHPDRWLNNSLSQIEMKGATIIPIN